MIRACLAMGYLALQASLWISYVLHLFRGICTVVFASSFAGHSVCFSSILRPTSLQRCRVPYYNGTYWTKVVEAVSRTGDGEAKPDDLGLV